MKKIGIGVLKFIKNIVLAFCFIYAFDLIFAGLEIFIPINFITIGVVTILGIPGLLVMIGVYFILI